MFQLNFTKEDKTTKLNKENIRRSLQGRNNHDIAWCVYNGIVRDRERDSDADTVSGTENFVSVNDSD